MGDLCEGIVRKLGAQSLVGEKAGDRLRQLFGLSWLDENPRLSILYDIYDAADACREHAQAGGEGLQKDHALAFAVAGFCNHRRPHEEVSRRIIIGQLVVGHCPPESYLVIDSQLAREGAQSRFQVTAADDP